jgi:hypothetical protein
VAHSATNVSVIPRSPEDFRTQNSLLNSAQQGLTALWSRNEKQRNVLTTVMFYFKPFHLVCYFNYMLITNKILFLKNYSSKQKGQKVWSVER